MSATAHRTQPQAESGVASIWVVVMLPVLLMLAWSGVEIGNAARAADRAAAVADAVALAAAARYADGAETAAVDAVAAATAAGVQLVLAPPGAGGGDLEFGDWNPSTRTFTPDPDGGRAVRATVRFNDEHPNGAIDGILPVAFGPGSFPVTRASVAVYCPPRDRTSLLLLGPMAPSLTLGGTAWLFADGVIALANSGDGLELAATSALRAPALALAELLGGVELGAGFDADVDESSAVPDDPYGAVALPTPDVPTPIKPSSGAVEVVEPGTHEGLVAAFGEYVLAPGDHVFTAPIRLSGTAVLRLSNARIVLAAGSAFELLDGVQVLGAAQSATADPMRAWLAVRSADVELVVGGAVDVDVDGLVYAPQSRLRVGGNARWVTKAGILNRVLADGASVVSWSGGVPALQQPLTAGRARLVR